MGAVPVSRGEQTRERILDAAETIFAEQDYSAARLEDVAQAVGIRRASIVYYFSGKQELYDAVEQRVFDAMMARTRQALDPDAPAIDRVLSLIDSWLDFMVERPTVPRLLLRDSANTYPNASAPVRISAIALQAWEEVVRAGQASGELAPANPMHLLHLLGASPIYYAATGQLLGEERSYDPAAPEQLEAFRGLLHKSARALLLPHTD
ncbi:TetR/AcrR family transcriptional regulator [Parahaliea mediterranea]|uniref:TetR family transcriptional regulator n=1 Tax=Parahaliea mediterranea TaxID=651086 RepID=A0A939IM00_9GAMM|nr:TetR/AcrR family transcriptional regulator [Parahaliea mediterranea]MBN7796518.1 TetR family transcriptional regulator [Parahaliea mediterranea]